MAGSPTFVGFHRWVSQCLQRRELFRLRRYDRRCGSRWLGHEGALQGSIGLNATESPRRNKSKVNLSASAAVINLITGHISHLIIRTPRYLQIRTRAICKYGADQIFYMRTEIFFKIRICCFLRVFQFKKTAGSHLTIRTPRYLQIRTPR